VLRSIEQRNVNKAATAAECQKKLNSFIALFKENPISFFCDKKHRKPIERKD
jgi:hypothetical protein